MLCGRCQVEKSNGSIFYGEYGQPFKPEITCPQCNHSNIKGSKFCNKCSQPITGQPLSSPPSKSTSNEPTFFANNHCPVKNLLGHGGEKKPCFSHDNISDWDTIFNLIPQPHFEN